MTDSRARCLPDGHAEPQIVTPYMKGQVFQLLIRLVLGAVCLAVALSIGRVSFMIADCILFACFMWWISRFGGRASRPESSALDSMEGLVMEPTLRTFRRASFDQLWYLPAFLVVLALPLGEGAAPGFGCFSGLELGLAFVSARRVIRERRYERKYGRRVYTRFVGSSRRFTLRPRVHLFYVRSTNATGAARQLEGGGALTSVELVVLHEAGGDKTLGNAYHAVQLYSVFDRQEDLIETTDAALLRLLDLGLVCFVETPDAAKRQSLDPMTRQQLLAILRRERDAGEVWRDKLIWFDQTPEGRAVLAADSDRVPIVSGRELRPWLR